MTIKEIALMCDIAPETVKNRVRELYPNLMVKGKITELNQEQSVRVVDGLKVEVAKQIQPTNNLYVTKSPEDMITFVEQVLAVLKVAAPKAKVYDQICDSTNLKTINEAAKILGTGQNKLFEYLKKQSILYGENTPYQHYINSGYFRVKERLINKGSKIEMYSQTYVTGKGLIWLQGKLNVKAISGPI